MADDAHLRLPAAPIIRRGLGHDTTRFLVERRAVEREEHHELPGARLPRRRRGRCGGGRLRLGERRDEDPRGDASQQPFHDHSPKRLAKNPEGSGNRRRNARYDKGFRLGRFGMQEPRGLLPASRATAGSASPQTRRRARPQAHSPALPADDEVVDSCRRATRLSAGCRPRSCASARRSGAVSTTRNRITFSPVPLRSSSFGSAAHIRNWLTSWDICETVALVPSA